MPTLSRIEFSEERPEEGVQHLSALRGRDRDGKRIFLDVSVSCHAMSTAGREIYGSVHHFGNRLVIDFLQNFQSPIKHHETKLKQGDTLGAIWSLDSTALQVV